MNRLKNPQQHPSSTIPKLALQLIHMVNHSIYHMDFRIIKKSRSASWLQDVRRQLRPFFERQPLDQRGSFLIAAIVIIIFLVAIGTSLSLLITSQYSTTKKYFFDANAMQVAEAGIEQTVKQVNQDNDFGGYTSAQTFFNDTDRGRGIYTTNVSTSPDGKMKTIVSIGQIFRNPSDVSPYVTRKIKTIMVGTSSAGYSVITGPGGLILGGGASILNSDVYVNGYISMSGNTRIGSESDPRSVDVANYQCPLGGGADWPELCSDGTQPITLSGSATIFGTVCATGQTSTTGSGTSSILGGNGGLGLKSGCVAPNVSTPTYDRAGQIAAVTTTGTPTSSNYDCSTWNSAHGSNGFTVTWPSNLELTGDVKLSSSCKLIITGNVYITGNLTIAGAASIQVADSVGTTRPVIMVDGTINAAGSGSVSANSSGTGAEFISFANSTGNPGVTSLTGQELYDSQKMTTISIGGGGHLAGMVFDAYWGKIVVDAGGTIGSAIGKTVDMSGAGKVTFGVTVASGTKTWTIRSYQRLYN